MEFIVRSLRNKPDVVEVRYDCQCGCKPRAQYKKDSDDASYEHCCCGQIHFVGAQAEERLKTYLGERSTQGMDNDVGEYSIHTQQVDAPWGGPVSVAYGIPAVPREH